MWFPAAFARYLCARVRARARACASACLGVYAAGLCARKHFSHARVELQGMSVALDRAVRYRCGGIAGRIRVRGDCLSRARPR
jgi:hypothetical protein